MLHLLVAATARSTTGDFNCTPITPPPVPTNISFLHPAHIDYVMALGDSITAAFAVRSDLYEGRDISWSVGVGDPGHITLPFLMQQYNARQTIEGMSTKKVLPNDITKLPHNDYHPKTDHLNVAESSGAVHRGSLEEQWAFLTTAAKGYPASAFEKGWKVITLWMTANDVCGECDAPLAGSPYLVDWTTRTDTFLQNVSETFSNVYVNLVSTLDLSNVARIQRSKLGCKIEHQILKECGCVDKGNETQLEMLDTNVHTMNAELHTLAKSWRSKLVDEGRWDMAVVMQPYQEGVGSQLDWHWLNTLDCFHPSELGHASLAKGLWNSMLNANIPFGATVPVACPTAETFFYTGEDRPAPPPPRTL